MTLFGLVAAPFLTGVYALGIDTVPRSEDGQIACRLTGGPVLVKGSPEDGGRRRVNPAPAGKDEGHVFRRPLTLLDKALDNDQGMPPGWAQCSPWLGPAAQSCAAGTEAMIEREP
jgi:hypothetical protein